MAISWKRTLRILAYALLVGVILLATVLLVAIGRGYRIDLRNGQITGGGLVLVGTIPSAATVSIDGKEINDKTPARITLKSGNHTLGLSKDGYRPWHKDISVSTSQVTWAEYPVLVPQTPTINTVVAIGVPTHFQQSPNRRLLALVSGGKQPRLSVLEIGSANITTAYEMPAELVKQKFEIDQLAWSADNERLLIEIKSPDSAKQLVINRLSGEILDLNDVFKLTFSSLQFSDRDGDLMYGLAADSLHKINLGGRTVSKPPVTGVKNFIVRAGDVYLVQNDGSGRKVARLTTDDTLHTIVGNLPAGGYQLEFVAYDSKRYLVLLDQAKRQVSLFDATSESQQTVGRFDTVTADAILVNPNDRFLVMSSGSDFATYDFEFAKLYRFSLPSTPQTSLTWFDSYHLLSKLNGAINLFEFDGGNLEALADTATALPAFASRDREAVYFTTPEPNGAFALRSVRIKD